MIWFWVDSEMQLHQGTHDEFLAALRECPLLQAFAYDPIVTSRELIDRLRWAFSVEDSEGPVRVVPSWNGCVLRRRMNGQTEIYDVDADAWVPMVPRVVPDPFNGRGGN